MLRLYPLYIYVTVHVHTYVQSYQSKDLNKTYGMVTKQWLSLVLVQLQLHQHCGRKKKTHFPADDLPELFWIRGQQQLGHCPSQGQHKSIRA